MLSLSAAVLLTLSLGLQWLEACGSYGEPPPVTAEVAARYQVTAAVGSALTIVAITLAGWERRPWAVGGAVTTFAVVIGIAALLWTSEGGC